MGFMRFHLGLLWVYSKMVIYKPSLAEAYSLPNLPFYATRMNNAQRDFYCLIMPSALSGVSRQSDLESGQRSQFFVNLIDAKNWHV